jgi:hypothetical protein
MSDRDNLPSFLSDEHEWDQTGGKPLSLYDYAWGSGSELPGWIEMRIKITRMMRRFGHTPAEIAETVNQIQDPAVRFADEALESIMSGMPKP